MSLKNKFFAAATSAVAVFAFSTFATAQETKPQTEDGQKIEKKGEYRKRDGMGRREGYGKGMRRGMKGGMHGGFAGIDLTEAQKAQLKTLRQSLRPTDADREARHQQMQAYRDAKRAGTLTAEQKEQFKAFRQEQHARRRQMHEQMLAILTPEQRQQLETRKQERRQRMEQYRQERKADKPVN